MKPEQHVSPSPWARLSADPVLWNSQEDLRVLLQDIDGMMRSFHEDADILERLTDEINDLAKSATVIVCRIAHLSSLQFEGGSPP